MGKFAYTPHSRPENWPETPTNKDYSASQAKADTVQYHKEQSPHYGYRRLTALVQGQGHEIGAHTVRKVLRGMKEDKDA